MYKIIILFLFLSFGILNCGQLPKMLDYGLEYIGFYNMAYKSGETAVLFYKKYYSGFDQGGVIINKNDEWTELPSDVITGDSVGYLKVSGSQSTINYDSTGSIWVSGYSLYNYNDGKWREIFIDDSFRNIRSYGEICIDKFNNVWVTTEIFSSGSPEKYSELLRYDGKRFETVIRINNSGIFQRCGADGFSGYVMAALPDGRIVLSRKLSDDDEDIQQGILDDIYFINQDFSFQRLRLQTDTWPEGKLYSRKVAQIFPDKNKIWFAMGSLYYYKSLQMDRVYRCCSGLSMLRDDGSWKIFNETDGLVRGKDSTTEPIYMMARLDEDRLFAIGRKRVYNIDRSNRLIELNWEDIIANSEFILSHSYYKTEEGIASLTKSFEFFYKDMSLQSKRIKLIDHGDAFWLLLGSGILILPKSVVTGVEENKANVQALLYPNPAGDIININGSGMEYSYSIFNTIGEKLLEGKARSSEIDISSLSDGSYYIRLQFAAGEIKTENFIKLDN